jgi:gliding motility-associated-like protein
LIKLFLKLAALILAACIQFSLPAFSQKQANYWYFGYKAAANFTTGTAVAVPNSALITEEGSASISDKNGNLLFYTNGVQVRDRTHAYMANGDGLFGNISSTQSAVIVPHPGNPKLYYIFTVDYHGGNRGMNFSVVDISENGGLGRVTVKNQPLAAAAFEKITAVHTCNNQDVWVVVRLWNSASFYAYKIDRFGLNDVPVVSNSPFSISGDLLGKLGAMKISPDGRHIAAAHAWSGNFIELGSFSDDLGQVTNVRRLSVAPPGGPSFSAGPYGVEFSSNSRFLYIYASYGSRSSIYQFDVTAADVQASMQLIGEINTANAGSMQLGLDRKIYVTNAYDSSLSVINQPNLAGAASDLQVGVVPLTGGSALGLPNFITSYFKPDYGPGEIFATGCGSGTLNFTYSNAAVATSMRWDFGDPASGASNTSTAITPSHTYTSTGFYDVTLIITRHCVTDTLVERVYSGNFGLSLADTYGLCTGDELVLSAAAQPGLQYLWSNGATTPSITVREPGFYKVTVKAGCVVSDSTEVIKFDKPSFDLGPDRAICPGSPVQLSISAANMQYLWSTGNSQSGELITRGGIYWGRALDPVSGCSFSDTIFLDDRPLPRPVLGKDTMLCSSEELMLQFNSMAGYAGVTTRWQDGSTGTSFRVTREGTYTVTATNGCETLSDTVIVRYSNCEIGVPNAFSPNGDGFNDRFRPRYGYGITNYKLVIFNRYGQKVFESAERSEGWDGTAFGRAQPVGTYVWMMTYNEEGTGERRSRRGTVTLVR